MGSRERSWAFAASATAAVAVITALVSFRLGSGAYPLPGVSSDPRLDVGDVLTVVVLAATGLLILHEQPRHPVGWMLMFSGLCLAGSATMGVYGVRAVADATVAWPLGVPALAVAGALWLPAVSICFSLLPQRYPDGALVGPRWRVLWWVSLAAAACVPVVLAFSPGAIDDWVEGLRPFQPPSWVGPIAVALVVFGFLGTFVGLFAGLVGLLVRFRRGTVLQRRQIAWLVVPLVMIPLATFVIPGAGIMQITMVLTASAVAVGVLRYGMLGPPVTLRRLLVWLPLTLLVALLIGAVTTWVGRVSSGAADGVLLASIIIAALILPARDLLLRLVDGALYGDRDDPLAVVDRVAAGDPGSPQALVAALAAALRSPGVALEGPDGSRIAESGTITDRAEPMPLGGGGAGTLRVMPRRGEQGLDRDDRRLLGSLTPFLAAALEARQLTQRLTIEQQRTAATARQERDRLRRDLHDGLGPSLSGIALGAEAARQFLPADPAAAQETLGRIHDEAVAATAEVRRVIDDLGPSVLQRATLGEALRQSASLLPMPVEVRCDPAADDPPPSIADTAYRIASEALTNAARHSAASRCAVELRREHGTLLLRVSDNGDGLDGAAAGVGLTSMRHRAASAGGSLIVHSEPGAGTTVTATLPWEER